MYFDCNEELAVGDSLDSYYKAFSMDCSEVEVAISKITDKASGVTRQVIKVSGGHSL